MTKDDILALFKRYQKGECTPEEKAILESWYLQYHSDNRKLNPEQIEEFGKQILQQLPVSNISKKYNLALRLMTAATLAVFLVGLSFYLLKPKRVKISHSAHVIRPGSDKAVLTVADGTIINLNEAKNGVISNQSGVDILKTKSGELIYKIGTEVTAESIGQFNTISTPKGGKWQVELSDHTHVWLNAASSITYPVSFAHQKNRSVAITGEAYFEVAKDQKHPFIVKAGAQTIKVLGTHFNINAYSNEPTLQTTLLEGSVQLATNKRILFLKPGEQASLSPKDITINTVDTEPITAWKKGDFIFKNIDFKASMRQIERWYDVDVVYQSEPKDFTPGGWVSRSKDINSVLKIMELTEHVHFKVDGRRIVVTQ
ncbi:FecR family protein [uncultured Mucilaginibacter sp.]|uniref:FecR family protein n=1 Tax=uncultured Mucilaginibacter sp. TaxID=797541 RepID=UPI0025D226D0|nr:FecR family protein [uncultured Mucilaginibacter sp.]